MYHVCTIEYKEYTYYVITIIIITITLLLGPAKINCYTIKPAIKYV